jgi:hypothetical protein
MNGKRQSAVNLLAYRDALTLSLHPGASPFGLSEDERNFGPEDWAWLFLSLNQDYRDKYQERANDADIDISSKLAKPQTPGLKSDKNGECAKHFGLSVWVPPSSLTLAPLANDVDSWFFPLKRPIAESPPPKHLRPRVTKEYTYISPNEDLFGYRPPLRIPHYPNASKHSKQRVQDVSTWTNIWVAIDCSIPPAGQVAALTNLARATRRKLQEGGWADHDNHWDSGIEDIARSDAFSHSNFSYAAGATDKVTDVRSVWRAVVIDPLGAIVDQREQLLRTLRNVHRNLIAKGLAKEPPFERFQNFLPTKLDADGIKRNGGSYLKALFTLAELRDRGLTDPQAIARITGTYSSNGRYQYAWMRDFHPNIEQYIDDARQMIEGGYRMLVHAQKPS